MDDFDKLREKIIGFGEKSFKKSYYPALQKKLKELENALEQANEASRLKEELIAIMSHELRTPLTGILGFSQMLSMDKNLPPKYKKKAEYIYKSSARLNDLLSNLLELSVIQAGKEIRTENEYFNIKTLIEDIFLLLKIKLDETSNTYEVNIDSIDKMYSDPLRLQQILYNIIGNAIKFTTNGRISVNISTREQNYFFEISDTGIGIDKEFHKLIFDVFKQIDSSPISRKYQGVGLGLSVCKSLVNVLGGEIWVESSPGKGSSFYFTIPVKEKAKPEEKAYKESAKQLENSNEKNISLLFAEDDVICYGLIETILKTGRINEFKGFYDGDALLKYYKENRNVNVIVLDIQMPVLNGIECLKKIRGLDNGIPVIALSAFSMEKDREKLLSLGFNDFIGKPIKPSELIDKICKITNY
jgi:nitrogen-specific signal transduction histidine kinase/CheY-like chemotaxis protein